jgi:hypothetical protein
LSASPQHLAYQTDHIQWAARALDHAIRALAEAERDGASPGEILRLCDKVIARRLRVQMINVRAGRPAPRRVAAQMTRDRELLHQQAEADDIDDIDV